MIQENMSFVHPDAKIGKNVRIDAFAYVADNVHIGEGTWIGPNATVLSGARIGKHCQIFPGAVISGIPQDLKFEGEETTAEIGAYTTVRECVTINRGTSFRGKTKVGSNCLLMAYAHVAHDCTLGDHVILANSVNLAGHVVVEDFAILEGTVAVQQFVKIGGHAFVTGGSMVRKNVPPYVKAGREPLSFVGVNTIGLHRRGYDLSTIQQIEDIYRLLYVRGYNTTKAVKIIQEEIEESREKNYILDFIKGSTKGIMRGLKKINAAKS